jgi:twitching motility protein PilT
MTKAIAKLVQIDQTHQIPSQLLTGREYGMQNLDQALITAVQAKEVDPDDAYHYAVEKRALEKFISNTQLLARPAMPAPAQTGS